MTDQEISRLQRMHDARTIDYLAQGPGPRQEAMAEFILACADMAAQLKALNTARRSRPTTNQNVEDIAGRIQAEIERMFRGKFGHPMFVEPREPTAEDVPGGTLMTPYYQPPLNEPHATDIEEFRKRYGPPAKEMPPND